MGCTNTTCTNTCTQTSRGCGYVTIIVLYILLAIILSSFVCYKSSKELFFFEKFDKNTLFW